jgi:hypothetical protein
VCAALRQAWELDDAEKAERPPRERAASGGGAGYAPPSGWFFHCAFLHIPPPERHPGQDRQQQRDGLAGLAPLAPTAAASPLYNMFSAGLGAPDTIPNNVAVGGQMWPIMPPPEQADPPPALTKLRSPSAIRMPSGA